MSKFDLVMLRSTAVSIGEIVIMLSRSSVFHFTLYERRWSSGFQRASPRSTAVTRLFHGHLRHVCLSANFCCVIVSIAAALPAAAADGKWWTNKRQAHKKASVRRVVAVTRISTTDRNSSFGRDLKCAGYLYQIYHGIVTYVISNGSYSSQFSVQFTSPRQLYTCISRDRENVFKKSWWRISFL